MFPPHPRSDFTGASTAESCLLLLSRPLPWRPALSATIAQSLGTCLEDMDLSSMFSLLILAGFPRVSGCGMYMGNSPGSSYNNYTCMLFKLSPITFYTTPPPTHTHHSHTHTHTLIPPSSLSPHSHTHTLPPIHTHRCRGLVVCWHTLDQVISRPPLSCSRWRKMGVAVPSTSRQERRSW